MRIRVSETRNTRNVVIVFILFVLAAPALFQSCSATIANYDPIALDKAVTLKLKSLELVEKAEETYASHEKEIRELMREIEQAYEYAANIPKNSLTARQWQVLKDPDSNLLGGFFTSWAKNGKLNPVLIREAAGIINQAFTAIIRLETLKNR